MSERFVINQPVVLNASFTVAGTATDPTAVTLVVTAPAGTATTYNWPSPATITRTSAGVFTVTVTATAAGTWSYVWTGTGTAADVQDGTFDVQDAEPRGLYCTRDELKKLIFSGATEDDSDDMLLDMCIESACAWIDQWTSRPCGFLPDTADQIRTYEACDFYFCKIDDLVSLTTLKTDADGDGVFEVTWNASDYQLLPANTAQHGQTLPYNKIHAVGSQTFPWATYGPSRSNKVQVTGKFGWPSLPPAVRTAALLLSNAAYERRKSPSGVIGGFPDTGGIRVSTRLDPDVERLLSPFRRVPILAA